VPLTISYLCLTNAVWLLGADPRAVRKATPCSGAQPHLRAAEDALDRNDPAEAERLLNRLQRSLSDCSEVLILSGQILAMKQHTMAAREMLEKACRLDPNNPEAHYQLGVFFDSRRLHPEAVEQFEKVSSLRPRDPRAYDYLALNSEALGNAEMAETAYKKGLQVNEGPLFDSFLDYNYGRFLMKLNRLTESQVCLDRAVQLAPKTRPVYYERGRLNLRLQKYKEARSDAERALSLADPSGFVLDLQVYYLLASIYTRLGDATLAGRYAALCRTSSVPIQSQGRGDR
jgi:tetratricopeptide (TPR) repeat protein